MIPVRPRPIDGKPYAALGYVQVRGLADRLITRYLRTQRRNMTRFFQARGLHEFASRMDSIRSANHLTAHGKNVRFRKVLDDYAALVAPNTEATSVPVQPEVVLPVAGTTGVADTSDRVGSDAGDGVGPHGDASN